MGSRRDGCQICVAGTRRAWICESWRGGCDVRLLESEMVRKSDSAAFAKFYIKVPSQWGRHQTSLELEFPFAQLEKCFSQFRVQLG